VQLKIEKGHPLTNKFQEAGGDNVKESTIIFKSNIYIDLLKTHQSLKQTYVTIARDNYQITWPLKFFRCQIFLVSSPKR
jgi:hypothetical protein